jgi:hypothetical protein
MNEDNDLDFYNRFTPQQIEEFNRESSASGSWWDPLSGASLKRPCAKLGPSMSFANSPEKDALLDAVLTAWNELEAAGVDDSSELRV